MLFLWSPCLATSPAPNWFEESYNSRLTVDYYEWNNKGKAIFSLNNELVGIVYFPTKKSIEFLYQEHGINSPEASALSNEYKRIFNPKDPKGVLYQLAKKIQENYNNFRTSKTIVQGVDQEDKLFQKYSYTLLLELSEDAPHQVFMGIKNMLKPLGVPYQNTPSSNIWKN